MTIKIEVTPEQLKALKNIYRGDDRHCIRQRAHAIMLLHQEQKTPEALSAILSVSRVTIYNWISRWRHDGIDGLYDFEGRGRKPLFSQDEEVIVLQEVEKNPSSIRQAAVEIEKRTGKKAHPETLKKSLKCMVNHGKEKENHQTKNPTQKTIKKGKKRLRNSSYSLLKVNLTSCISMNLASRYNRLCPMHGRIVVSIVRLKFHRLILNESIFLDS